MAIRQIMRATQRSFGFESIKAVLGLPQHSHPLLQDTDIHDKIQV